jgi:hypothetical protein
MSDKALPLDEEEAKPALTLSQRLLKKAAERRKAQRKRSSEPSNKEVTYSGAPFFLTRKIHTPTKSTQMTDINESLNIFAPKKKPVIDPGIRILKLSTDQSMPIARISPFKIVYLNTQSNVAEVRTFIESQIKSVNPPDMIVLHEVAEKNTFRFAEYRTFTGQDGRKTINILTARDLGPTLNVVNDKGYPTIKMKEHTITILHSLQDLKQHILIPQKTGYNTLLGDFNLRTFPNNIPEVEKYDFRSVEPRGCVGIFSCKPINVTWQTVAKTDHCAGIFLLDIPRPPPFSLIRKDYVDGMLEQAVQPGVDDKLFHQRLNIRKLRYPVKCSHGYKKLWQFRDFKINERSSKFISTYLLDKKIVNDIDILFKGPFKRKEGLTLSAKDENILRVFIRAFFLLPMKKHLHSNARDINGVSYNYMVKLMYKNPNTDHWTKFFTSQWNKLKYVKTKVIALKKKRVIQNIHDVRFIAVSDAFLKIFEEICAPILLAIRWIIMNKNPGQFGFQTGLSTFDLIRNLMLSNVHNPPSMTLEALIPDYTMWEPSWKEEA